MYKIGFSKDTHKFKFSFHKSIYLGGTKIINNYKIISNSDGDVLFHSLSEALIGAIGNGDLGENEKYFSKPYISSEILNWTMKLLCKKKFNISNIDILVEFDLIKMSKYRKLIIENISKILKINTNKINLKFTKSEKKWNKFLIVYSNVLLFSKI